MNPIHETGFASLVVLFFATGPSALAALVALVLAWKSPKGAVVAANVAIVLASLVCFLAVVTTVKLHSRVDFWIDSGGYGPPAEIHAKYGPQWHGSARITAWVGLVFTAFPFTFSALAYAIAQRKGLEITTPVVLLVIAGIAIFLCSMMGVL